MDWVLIKVLTTDTGSINTFGANMWTYNRGEEITIDETLGDDIYIMAGDLVLKRAAILTVSAGGYHEWLAVYIDNTTANDLVGVFEFDVNAYEYDEKSGFYTYRLKSIQRYIWEQFTNIDITYDATTGALNTALNGVTEDLYSLSVIDGDGLAHSSVGRYCFPIGNILDNFDGLYEDLGLQFDNITHPITQFGASNDVAVLWRGRGHQETQSEADVIRSTFDYEVFYEFTVSGVTTSPIAYSSIYTNNSSTFEIIEINLSSGSGTLRARRISGTNSPTTTGTLTKSSGTGDATISYSAWDSEVENFSMTWADFFNIIANCWDCYIQFKPIINDAHSLLTVDMLIYPRVGATASGAISQATFAERKLIKNKYEIDGVRISANNYDFELGAKDGHILSKSVDVAERGRPNSNDELDLYIGITSEDLVGGYDITNPTNFFFVSSGGGDAFIKDQYEDRIGAGDGYEGQIICQYNNGSDDLIIRPPDQLSFNSITILITSMHINGNFLAEFEGVKL